MVRVYLKIQKNHNLNKLKEKVIRSSRSRYIKKFLKGIQCGSVRLVHSVYR